ncbi:Jasmonate O-methyltransferase [Hordeum vulgare]|nr:Jasmonate O-methyltransferase [Hordeum vulgare]
MCESSTRCVIVGNMEVSHWRVVAPMANMELSHRRVVAPVATMEASHRRVAAPVAKMENAEQKKMKALIEAVIVELCSNTGTLLSGKMVIADLGCSTGPNALALVSIAIEAIHSHCLQFQQPPPEVSVFLNDLPENDFNTVVKSLVTLRQSNDPVVVAGITPGSFYERLFTSESVHLVCSSNSLHWLSKAPEELTRNLIPAYDIDEHERHERLPIVLGAYTEQFRKDFTLFLELRAKELVSGGRIIISLLGRCSNVLDKKFPYLLEIVSQILCVMVSEGVIDKEKFDSFYGLMYEPSDEELREIIQEEGSFSIREMRENDPRTNMKATLNTPHKFAMFLRSLFEPVLVQHFGYVMDEFVRTAERRYIHEGSFQDELARCPYVMLVVSLAKA